eukprot:TRINITY_DN56358_c0_g1_i1.p2 TRINITY_DN56358_c0_g1~~TRINITY_DN56358_c0_g1_i1.p2  ORF type:complete len:178 (-),score=31.99 TRINITY_DN56358_c0_g1_i1:207-740(-)
MSFDEYRRQMPWLAVPYSDRALKERLNQYFQVSGLPTLVLLDRDGSVIIKDGRSRVLADPTGSTWLSQRANPHPSPSLNGSTSVSQGAQSQPSMASRPRELQTPGIWADAEIADGEIWVEPDTDWSVGPGEWITADLSRIEQSHTASAAPMDTSDWVRPMTEAEWDATGGKGRGVGA